MEQDLDFSRSKLAWAPEIAVGDLILPVETIIENLEPHMTADRVQRLREVVEQRSLHLIPVLENIYDRGNVSAVMRSSEAFGFLRMYLVDQPGAKFKAANRVTRGAEKWLDVKSFTDPHSTVKSLKNEGYQIWATDLNTQYAIGDIDWSKPTAVVLGNEKDGVSPEMLKLVDGRFRIPMLGFSQSFNISVAASLLFYHVHLEAKKIGDRAKLTPEQKQQVLANYCLRCFDNPENILRAKLS